MANCSHLFDGYHKNILIDSGKDSKMMGSKDALRKRIRKWFKENHPDYKPQFFIQGSYKMRNGIRTKDNICDLDDGIYFFREPDVTASTLQGWVWEAVNGYTETAPEHRKKCIRSIFAGDYEVDHPVYYKIDGQPYKIAVKDSGFEDSDPKEMVDWFINNKDKDGNLLKAVKFLKGWCDNMRNKMPSGLAITILATNAKKNIVLNEREDITLRDILREIKRVLDIKFECVVPAVPCDDLFANFDSARRNNFLTNLSNFLTDADKALLEENELEASKLWRKHLGDRFPLGEDKKQNASAQVSPSIIMGASTSNPWSE